MTLKRMTKKSFAEMEQLYTNTTHIYCTLETLKRPVYVWDIFVFLAIQRLDPDYVKAWEQHLGSAKEPPTWKQFNEFLITRLLSLQTYEKSRTGKTSALSHPNNARSYFQGKGKSNHSNKPSSCYLCSAEHYIANCLQYTSKSVQQRVALIQKHKLCFYCLDPYRASVCRIAKRCQKCGHKHHTTIHKNTNVKLITSSSTPSTSENSSANEVRSKESHVLHSSIQQNSVSSYVLLATA